MLRAAGVSLSLSVWVAGTASCSLRDISDLDRATGSPLDAGPDTLGLDAGQDAPLEGDGPPASSIEFVQMKSSVGADASAATVSFANPVGAHHAVIVALDYAYSSGTETPIVTDALMNPFAPVIKPTNGNAMRNYVAVALDTDAGPDSVAVTLGLSRTKEFHVAILEYAGIGLTLSSALDVTASGGGTFAGGATMSSGVRTTRAPNELVFGFGTTGPYNGNGARVIKAGAGFTARIDPSGDTTPYNFIEDQPADAAGPYAATGTMLAGYDWSLFMATFMGQ